VVSELTGQVAIVTGGGSGLGRAGAIALARAGATVVVGDVGRATAVGADVADAGSCGALVERTIADHGRLDVLYNNAGVAWPGRDGFAPDVAPDVWDRVVAINLSGTFYCCHHAIPRMAETGGGAIVNTASSMAHLPLGGLDAYAASKGGVALLTRSLAPSAGRLGVRVNAISPGYVDTPMNSLIWDNDAVRDAFARGHATGLQDPDEIAEVVVFLASAASRSLTGAVLTCDRGWTAFKQPDLLRGP
jgi:NAD(P)-dependent dehydrogenase (short-subunit alcohol dehydrogenase family)